MSMSLTDAKAYVAGIVGGSNDPKALVRAAEAIARAYTDWQNQRFWTFLLRDTSLTTAVSGCTCTSTSATVTAPTTGGFDFVNIGQTVTIAAADTATLAAGTTVSSYVRGTDGVITTITLSNAFGGTTDTSSTLTFSADIPLKVSVASYNLPLDFSGGYGGRLTISPFTPIKYIDKRYWDKITLDQSLQGVPEAYTTFNPISEGTQNFGTSRLLIMKTPDTSYTFRLTYFRTFNQSGTNIDVPDTYLYQFLDYARSIMLTTKRAQDDPQAYARQVQNAYDAAQLTDEQPNDDDDGDIRLKAPNETYDIRPIVGNGNFDVFPL